MINQTFSSYFRKAAAVMALSFTFGAANAVPLAYGTYDLNNHPDGGAAAPYYGLRLDGLEDRNSSTIYTFDFDDVANGSSMMMDYDGSSIRIYGTAWGGEDTGNSYTGATLWSINFLYSTNVSPNGDGAIVDDIDFSNFGTISDGTTTYNLTDYSGNNDYTFKLDYGHRGFPGLSGWGWVNHYAVGTDAADSTHLAASDWLFTATLRPGTTSIPEPGVLALLVMGLLGLGVARKRV